TLRVPASGAHVLHSSRLAPPPLSFFPDTAPTELYPLSLHDALPISSAWRQRTGTGSPDGLGQPGVGRLDPLGELVVAQRLPQLRSEEHTSELQSRENLVCRLLLEKKKKTKKQAKAGDNAARTHAPPT